MTKARENQPTGGGSGRPKAFFSYSWSSPEYADRVEALASDLQGHGVEVVLDQWDLEDGQDLHAFMEQAVNDPTVSHVLILCDPMYAKKANDRKGGVGKETLIISPDVYKNVKQSRVIPLIMERDETDEVRVPTYLDGRKFIDFSRPELEAEAYEQLLRTLFRRPARKRPALGPPPEFLREDYVALQTTGTFSLFRAAVMGNRPTAAGIFADYLERLEQAYAQEELKDPPVTIDELGDVVFASIERFRPYRNEFINACRIVGRYAPDVMGLAARLHDFFERTINIRYQHVPKRWDWDAETENLGFIGWEMTLYAVAILLREGAFSALARMLAPFHVQTYQGGPAALRGVEILAPGFRVLPEYSQRKQVNHRDFAAYTFIQSAQDSGIPQDALLEADLLLWYRAAVDKPELGTWYPRTLAWLGYSQRLLLFERSRNPEFFENLAPVLGVSNRADFAKRFQEIEESDFYTIGRSLRGRQTYAQQLGIDG